MKTKFRNTNQRGFTIMEVIVATIVLLVGIVAVAQLVPVAVNLNSHNRRDSTSLVIAQREMDALIDQPLSAAAFTDPQGLTCPAAGVCNLGVVVTPAACAGNCPPVMLGNRPFIDYSLAPVAGYQFIYTDPDDPSGASYDIRWAVVTFPNGANAVAKRFIVGVRKQGGNSPLLPIALDTMVSK